MFKMLKNNRGSWGAVAAATASVVGGAASSYIANETAQDGQIGYDMPMMDPSPWDRYNQQLTAQAAQQQLLNAQQGRLPPGQEILLNRMRQEQLRRSKEQMYGREGQRGGSIMNNTMAMGSLGGVGPKAMMAQGSRAMQDYAGRTSQIQNYIDTLKYSGLQKAQSQAIQQMQNMPRSLEIPYTGRPVKMDTPAQPGMDTGLGDVDWFKVADQFGWGKQPQQQVIPQKTLDIQPIPQYQPLTLPPGY